MKDFFFFSKSQRIGILILIALIILTIAAIHLLPLFFHDDDADYIATQEFQKELKAFEDSLEKQQKNRYNKPEYTRRYSGYQPGKQEKDIPYSLFPFDPNTADSADFVRLGLRPYIAGNILKYRAKGGNFRKPEDFARIYGISEEKYQELESYIQIQIPETEAILVKTDTTPQKTVFSQKKDTVLELNTADTTELMMIRGIGRWYAQSIVRYREQLGGFYCVEQLREVPHMNEENYLRIKDSFTVDSSLITPLYVNRASVERLKRHPYLTFTQAKAIYELRRLKIKLSDLEQLRKLDELSDADLQRLRPYLSFETP